MDFGLEGKTALVTGGASGIGRATAAQLIEEGARVMESRGWGRVVIVTSENAVQPYSDEAVYNVAKAGLLNFAKGLSPVAARRGVLVNTVSPAFIETPMIDGMMDKRAQARASDRDETVESFLDQQRHHIEPKRRGKPEEVAAAIVFLCSEKASFVVGSNYRVVGGSVEGVST